MNRLLFHNKITNIVLLVYTRNFYFKTFAVLNETHLICMHERIPRMMKRKDEEGFVCLPIISEGLVCLYIKGHWLLQGGYCQ